ncbi:hypothetical protein HBH92_123740 [Parastagonospora nodorum]|nr:hypothetical protein HBH51_064950 [Parastagonospora nodorum]KAH4067607.1 hypothetical protein HBH50_129380 [Parastagonospora nodorum]KAH4191163.1 hypothetical protein HBH42_121480 [Parastagonospora nodorum]KAH4224906.1 hypothetical protein HBI06_121870 [Parastagonospora nodorum]KAH4410757.1 hypothetical protein HBH92_123740 [Parastagonospora nodorum]
MALEPDAVLSETDFRTYNLIKGNKASDFIGYRAAVVCAESKPVYVIEPVIAETRSKALRKLLEAMAVEMGETLQFPELDGYLERLEAASVLGDTNDVREPGGAAHEGSKRAKTGKKSVGTKDEEAVSSTEDELAHDFQEAHVLKARRGRKLRSGTKLGEVKRKRKESVTESDQETEDDNSVVDSKRVGKQAMKAPEEAGVKRGRKRGGRGGRPEA